MIDPDGLPLPTDSSGLILDRTGSPLPIDPEGVPLGPDGIPLPTDTSGRFVWSTTVPYAPKTLPTDESGKPLHPIVDQFGTFLQYAYLLFDLIV